MTAPKPQQPLSTGTKPPTAPVKIALNAKSQKKISDLISDLKIEGDKPGGWLPYKKG
ncbi:hypothetical protein [Azospirillum sp. B21]|uniref:hypothetical protein n=1 Tax=Azospirillum sp. B21 TaxID=2607496 RepID=UPI00165FED16|nr:hypothetical protein [Azospirillum sp. B21]